MKSRIFFYIIVCLTFNSCGIFITHKKDKLIDFESSSINYQSLKLNGYYYAELEFEYGENAPHYIEDYIKRTGINKVKYLSVFFINQDGFVIKLGEINGLSHYYCADKDAYDNTYESAHKTIHQLLKTQNSTNKRTKRICGFNPDDIGNKGLAKIEDNNIKIQYYLIETQNPKKDSFNSGYLYELNGIIKSDSSFVINSKTEFRTDKITSENTIFHFRETDQKPNIRNYFKIYMKRR